MGATPGVVDRTLAMQGQCLFYLLACLVELAQLEPPPESAVPTETVDRGFLRVLPHIHGTDGAFAARLREAVRMRIAQLNDCPV